MGVCFTDSRFSSARGACKMKIAREWLDVILRNVEDDRVRIIPISGAHVLRLIKIYIYTISSGGGWWMKKITRCQIELDPSSTSTATKKGMNRL